MSVAPSLLAEVPLFERLSDEERGVLAERLNEVEIAAGQHAFKRGDPGDAVFIVVAGEIEIFVEDNLGTRIVFETAKPGDFFGELSLLDGEPRSASALAMSDARVVRVDREDLRSLFSKQPDAALEVLAVIGRRLREADKLLGARPPFSPNQAVEERGNAIARLADNAAAFAGTFAFLLMHLLWFATWILINTGGVKALKPFDPYPFSLLTTLVSLEAICLSCMVLIAASRQSAKDKIRSDVEYEANIRAGLEVTQLHAKVDGFQEQVLVRLSALEKGLGPVATRPVVGR